MNANRARGPLSRHFLVTSFFGALLIAGAMGYNNYRFSKYNFVNFDEFVLYDKSDLFVPKDEIYTVVFYSSNIQEHKQKLQEVTKEYPVLAVDFSQKREMQNGGGTIYVTAGINTLLKLSRRFNVTELPSAFLIKRVKKNEFKQESDIVGL